MHRFTLVALGVAVVGLCSTGSRAGAQEAPDTSWDVTKPRGTPREIDFTTSEGTWTALDVSPDGQWIVFDLLGHIYRMPIAGGQAVPITQESGIAINTQPQISPDGKSIAFISDRKGQMNVWVMDADGKNPKPVNLDPKTEYRTPVWTADGQFIIALKFTGFGPRSLVMFHRSGGQGLEVLKGEIGKNPFRPTISADGRYLYYDVYTGRPTGFWGQEDVLKGTIQIHRFDLKTGTVRPLTAGESAQQDRSTSGGAYAAEPSPDGRWLSFIRKVPGGTLNYKGQRFGPRSALWIRDLSTGGERLLMDPVEMDLAEESIPINGTYPAYKWMPDGRSIVLHQGGKIRRVDVASGQVSTIPFTARVHRTMSEQAWVKRRISDGPVDVRFIRWATASPDGRRVAFQALNRIWIQDLPNGTPRRVTSGGFQPSEFHPAWSPDGQSIAFATWQDSTRGALWVVDARGGDPRRVTRSDGEYAHPAWTPDGRELIAARGAGATARGQTLSRDPFFDVVSLPAAGGEETFIVQVGGDGGNQMPEPTVGADGRVYFAEAKSFGPPVGDRPNAGLEIVSVRRDGTDRIAHARIVNAEEIAVAPDGRYVAFAQGSNVYLAPLPAGGTGGAVPQIDRKGGSLPTTTLSTEGGLSPRWRNPGTLDFSSGNRVFAYTVATGKADTATVRLSAPRDLAAGSIALTGARIVTLDQKRVIPSGTIVVKAGRITCVGSCSTAGVDKVVSASGKTIIPGWIDMHAHHHREHLGMMPTHNFMTAVYLAYGVTTTFDPSTWAPEAFPDAELIETGQMVGPRVFSSAEAITNGDGPGTNDITSLEVAKQDVARRQSWGTVMLKQYLQPTRYQRQWVVEAARQLGMRTTAEGSMDLTHKIGMVMDGHSGGEHSTVHAPLYSDFLGFLARSRYVYSHTPIVSGYGAWNEEYFWQESPVWQDPKQQRWIPWRQLIPHTRRFIMRPVTDYSKDIMAQSIADLVALGGYSTVGSHGQEHGLGSHWDVWMMAKATGPMTALEVASLHGATFLGMEQDLGSITVGKLGDLMVLNGNPLENIRNTANIQYVMKGGTLYDAMSLDEIWPKIVKYGDYHWVQPEMYRIDEKSVDVWDKK
jgi:Tol biopolymer transport system component